MPLQLIGHHYSSMRSQLFQPQNLKKNYTGGNLRNYGSAPVANTAFESSDILVFETHPIVFFYLQLGQYPNLPG